MKHINNIYLIVAAVLLISNNTINHLLIQNLLLIPIFVLFYISFRIGKEIKNQYSLFVYNPVDDLSLMFYTP